MKGTPTLQPWPATLCPPLEEYDRPRLGWAPPRAVGSAKGTLNVAIPVESCAEKLSSMPLMVPLPFGTEIAWLVTPLLSSPVGRAKGSASVVGAATFAFDAASALTSVALT